MKHGSFIHPPGSRTALSREGLAIAEERNASNAVVKRFYGQGVQEGSTNYYYVRDHLGSVRELVDANEVVRGRWDYDLWGRRSANLITTNAVEADFGYTGHFEHPVSGLTLAPYRAYDAELGRWLSRDPIEEEGGINLYGYVGNAPISRIDPTGLWYAFNPVTWFDGGGYQGASGGWDAYQAVTASAFEQGAYAGLDGLIPLWDPFADNGFYDECDEGAQLSQAFGKLSQGAIWATGGIVATPMLARGAIVAANAAVDGGFYVAAAGYIGVQTLQNNPRMVPIMLDFAEGFIMPSAPPGTPAGSAGYFLRLMYDDL